MNVNGEVVVYSAAFADRKIIAEYFPSGVSRTAALPELAGIAAEIVPQLQIRLDRQDDLSVATENSSYLWTARKEGDAAFLCAEYRNSPHAGRASELLLKELCAMYRKQLKSQGQSHGSRARDMTFLLRYCYNELTLDHTPQAQSTLRSSTWSTDSKVDDSLRLKIGQVETEVASVREYLAASVIGMARERGGQVQSLLQQTNSLQTEVMHIMTSARFPFSSRWQISRGVPTSCAGGPSGVVYAAELRCT